MRLGIRVVGFRHTERSGWCGKLPVCGKRPSKHRLTRSSPDQSTKKENIIMINLGVTPVPPLYEQVGAKAVLNCEMTFENELDPLELDSWKAIATYSNKPAKETIGIPDDFWKNVDLFTADSLKNTTQIDAGQKQIPIGRRTV